MDNRITVYIASAYTIGDMEENVRKNLEVSNILIKNKFLPFAPLLAHFQNKLFPLEYEEWMDFDFGWVERCDILLRLVGKSSGADREVAHALKNGIMVFYSIEDLLTFFSIKQEKI